MFKPHDIRGKFSSEINQGSFYTLGKATAKIFPYLVVSGRDYRIGHQVLESVFLNGFESEGGEIRARLGNVPTAVISEENKGLGLCFTASHNPAGYCGVKFFIKNKCVSSNDILKLKKEYEILGGEEKKAIPSFKPIEPDGISKEIIWDYCEKLPPFQNAIYDLAGGAACALSNLFKNKIFYQPDADFLKHSPEPKDETLTELKKETIETKGLGFAFDGDADRVICVDNGKTIEGHVLLVGLAKQILNPKDKIIMSIDCSTEAYLMLEDEGFKPQWAPVGDVNVIEKAIECGAKLAGERSGHYSFLPEFPYSDGLRTAAIAVNCIKAGEMKSLAEEFKDVSIIESAYLVADFEKIKNYLNEQKNLKTINTIDGVKADFEDFSILIRQSNTEPKIKINSEAINNSFAKNGIELAKQAINKSIRK